jgi:hypothetical protein
MAELGISVERVCFIIFKAREFEAQAEVVEEDPGSNPTDEGFRGVLASYSDDATYDEVKQFIESLDIDEQCDLVALAWVGRGDFDLAGWAGSQELARERHNEHTAEYLLGMPLVADYLQQGLDALGISCEDIEKEHL